MLEQDCYFQRGTLLLQAGTLRSVVGSLNTDVKVGQSSLECINL